MGGDPGSKIKRERIFLRGFAECSDCVSTQALSVAVKGRQ